MSVEPKFRRLVLYGGTKSISRVFSKLEQLLVKVK